MSQSKTYQLTPEQIERWKRINASEDPREARHLNMLLWRVFLRQNKIIKI
jgi:hypothetical protein